MLELRVIKKLYDNKGKLYAYTIQDTKGNVTNIYSDALKEHIRNRNCIVLNMTLTSDNRLIDKKEEIKQVKKVSNTVQTNLVPSICGVQLKNIKIGNGREGEYYYGTVYYLGKKLGEWSQDPYGCIADNFEFNENILKEPLTKYKNIMCHSELRLETFMLKVLVLTEYYNAFLKMKKQGKFKVLTIITDSFDYEYITIPNNGMSNQLQELIDKYSIKIERNGMGKVQVKHFSTDGDFIIG